MAEAPERPSADAAVTEDRLRVAEAYVEQEEGGTSRYRGLLGHATTALLVAMSLFHLYAALEIVPAQVRPGAVVRIDVRWYVPRGRPQQDYTTLIHLGQPDRPPLSTGDSPPLGGSYPTRAWANGETIDDNYRLVIPADLAAGRYPVWIGMYDPAGGARLPVTVEGELQPNGVYLAGWVEVACAVQDVDCQP